MSMPAEEGDDLIRRADAMEKMEVIEESRITAAKSAYSYDRKIIESPESIGNSRKRRREKGPLVRFTRRPYPNAPP